MLLSLPDFDLASPSSVAEACALLAKQDGEARLFAGGTDLFVKMKHRRATPRHLINIKGIEGLDHISHDETAGLRIGALCTAQAINDSPVISEKFPVLVQAAGLLGTTHIRNLGTIGGNLANASPSAEFAPPLLVLGASVEAAGIERTRSIPIDEFFLGPGKSALAADEMVTEIRVPVPPAGAEAIYLKHGLRRMDVATASAAALLVADGRLIGEARIALGAVAPTPFRAGPAEAMLRGQAIDGAAADGGLLEQAARRAEEQTEPIDDLRGTAEYRRKIIRLLVRQSLDRVLGRLTGEASP